jgi:putative aminopeptidase FrvX
MNQREERALEILRELGSWPAVPFFEDGPAHCITEILSRLIGVEVRRDEYGNVIARYRNPLQNASSQPPIAFIAHMDHPGFEIISADKMGHEFMAKALGGVPVASLKKPVPALLLTHAGQRVKAELLPVDEQSSKDNAERLVRVRLRFDISLNLPLAVVFDLPDFNLDGDTIRMRALDDLAGCASILAALERVISDRAETDMYAVFTRAEEGGLFGARLMAEAGTLPRETLVVSVESSPVIPGVAQGEGPVIRTGDRAYTFDGDAEQALIAAREAILKRNSAFKSQRQLMSGGTCEATAFAVFGYRVTGLAFPLGNYHNATTNIYDPDGGVGAEYIKLSDYLGGVELIAEAAVSVAKRDDSPIRQRMRQMPDDVRERMRVTAGV